MYRLLLVDDETDVLDYFGRAIKDELCKMFEIDIYMVDSAKRALEYFIEHKVDIVISDVNMPEMNGLEMYQEIRKIWPKAKFVFLSGYMDFEYVYATAQDANTRFLTKLEPMEKIIDTISEIIAEIEQCFKEKELLIKAQTESKQAYHLFQNKAIGQFLYGIPQENIIQQNFTEFQIQIDLNEEIILLGAALDGSKQQYSESEERLGGALKMLMASYFGEEFSIYQYVSEHQTTPYIFVLQRRKETRVKIYEKLEYVQHGFAASVDNTISFAYGKVQPPFDENSWMLRRIQTILGYRNQEIEENIIPCDINQYAGSKIWSDEKVKNNWRQLEAIPELDSYIELGMEGKFFELFDSMIGDLHSVQSMNYTLAQEIYYTIAVLLLRYINMWQLAEKMAFQVEMYKLMRIDMYKDWAEATELLRSTAKAIFTLYFIEERKGLTGYVLRTKSYIKENVHRDLNLVILADVVHLNASYLSRLFHQETGEKLYDYILRCRMQVAKECIVKDTKRIRDVAKAVGYESVQSFNRAFKKCVGMSPLEYRNETMD
jgi:Response regulator containing CheY-like receiver domain and AraC-type DNA-binding domain